MGRIPEFRRNPAPSAVQTANISQAGSVAGGVSQLAQVGAEIAFRQAQIRDQQFVASKQIELEAKAQEVFRGWQQDHESDPVGKTEDLKKRFQTDIDSLMQQSPSVRAQESFRRMSHEMTARMTMKADAWANDQFVVNSVNQHEKDTDLLATQAFDRASPQDLDDLLKQHDMSLVALSGALGEQGLQEAKDKGRRALTVSMFEGLIEQKKFNTASGLLDSHEYDEKLGSDAKKKLVSAVNRARERERKTQAEIKDSTLKKLHTDPSSFLREINDVKSLDQVPGFVPLSFSAEGFAQREQYTEALGRKYNAKFPLLFDTEEADLIGRFKAGTPDQQTGFLMGLRSSMTGPQASKVAEQIFDKEPAYSAALAIVHESPKDAREIIQGQRLKSAKTDDLASTADYQNAFNEMTGDLFNDQPKLKRQLLEAVKAAHVKVASDAGEDLTNIDSSEGGMFSSKGSFRQAAEIVLGPVIEINDNKTLSFRDAEGQWVDEDTFEDFVDELDEDSLRRAGNGLPLTGDGPLPLDDFKNNASLRPAGDGIYMIEMQNGQRAMDVNGGVYLLDLKKIYKKPKGGFFKRGFDKLVESVD